MNPDSAKSLWRGFARALGQALQTVDDSDEDIVDAAAAQFVEDLWFAAAPTNDRWACVAANGWVLIKEDAYGMTLENYKRIFALALAAQASGKQFAIDSASSSPCVNGNVAWMMN